MKLEWHGNIIGVQPRIRMTRSFDQRQHSYLGYLLIIDGQIGGETAKFVVGIGKGAQAKHQFQAGDNISGQCELVNDKRIEPADYYKASKLVVQSRGESCAPPPWTGLAVDLDIYRERGHRRLSAVTYEKYCRSCKWGCRMAVEMIIDHWNPSQRKFRTETFCYGPKLCSIYKSGPIRKVPGRKGMIWEEEDWIDEQDTGHREPDD
jgi:hypothetical protein